MKATIYYNPSCGTARNVLNILKSCNMEIEIIEYLKNPPSTAQLIELLDAMQLEVTDIVRMNEAEKLGLNIATLSDEEIFALMQEHPILINRPIVKTDLGVKLCRPSEKVLHLIPAENIHGPFVNEQGIEIINQDHKITVAY